MAAMNATLSAPRRRPVLVTVLSLVCLIATVSLVDSPALGQDAEEA